MAGASRAGGIGGAGERLFWAVYNGLFGVAFLCLLPKFVARMRRRGGYRRGFLQRFGVYEPALRQQLAERPRVWIHAVSVGEMMMALRLARALRERRPGLGVVFSTTTSTGYALARQRLAGGDAVVYVPTDFPWFVRRVLRRLRPLALVLMDSELWPNLVRITADAGVPVSLVNGRLSARSCRGYRLVRPVFRRVLSRFSLLGAQTEQDAVRLRALGAPVDRVRVTGSLKFDLTPEAAAPEGGLREVLARAGVDGSGPVIVAGSTWPGEERELAAMYPRLAARVPGLKLVLVPRHAERADEVERELAALGVRVARRSRLGQGGGAVEPAAVVLVDTTGELMQAYALADVVFVGKSLTEHGGQNPIEPAMLGRATVFGPYMENFPGVADELVAAGGARQVADAAGLEQALGDRARAAVAARRGAADRCAELVLAGVETDPAGGAGGAGRVADPAGFRFDG